MKPIACNLAVGELSARNTDGNSPAHTQRPAAKFVPSHIAEVLLESAIEVAKQRMLDGKTREEKLSAWREMVRLIDQRTPARVRFMERMAGLA